MLIHQLSEAVISGLFFVSSVLTTGSVLNTEIYQTQAGMQEKQGILKHIIIIYNNNNNTIIIIISIIIIEKIQHHETNIMHKYKKLTCHRTLMP